MNKRKSSARYKRRRTDARYSLYRRKVRKVYESLNLQRGVEYVLYDDKRKVYVCNASKLRANTKDFDSYKGYRDFLPYVGRLHFTSNKKFAEVFSYELTFETFYRVFLAIKSTGAWRPIKVK